MAKCVLVLKPLCTRASYQFLHFDDLFLLLDDLFVLVLVLGEDILCERGVPKKTGISDIVSVEITYVIGVRSNVSDENSATKSSDGRYEHNVSLEHNFTRCVCPTSVTSRPELIPEQFDSD